LELHSERGTVTAEFAIALPAVLLTLVFSLQALSVQVGRIDLISKAGQLARAAARGEAVAEAKPEGKLVCVELKIERPFLIAEKQCARQLGL
jgi:Flp pilus assembly protein TadG